MSGYYSPRNRSFMGYMKRFHVKFLLCLLVFLYIIVPLLVFVNPGIINIFIFGNYFVFPFSDLSNPSSYGLDGVNNFRLRSTDGAELGIWHILPASLSETNIVGQQAFEDILASGAEIILYLHGKGQNRGSKIRVGTYKALLKQGYHVITVDYRGYGDSKGFPSEDGMVSDARTVYNWIKERSSDSSVFIYGHSLGTGVATKLARQLTVEGHPPIGLVLQNPFNNVESVMDFSKSAMPYRFLPWYMGYFKRALRKAGTTFSSDIYIAEVTCPLLIIHSDDDRVIPLSLANKLMTAAETAPSRKDILTKMAVLSGVGHNNAFQDPNFPQIVRKFTSTVVNRSQWSLSVDNSLHGKE